MSNTNTTKLTLYTASAALAGTSVSDAVMIVNTPTGPDAILIGSTSSDTVDRGRFTYLPLLNSLTYSKTSSNKGANLTNLTISPASTTGGKNPTPLPGVAEGKSGSPFQTFGDGFGMPVNEFGSFADTTPLAITSGKPSYLGIQYNSLLGDTYYGWMSYQYDGKDVIIGTIAMENVADAAVNIGIIPESSTVMSIIGGVLAGGFIGIRTLRKKKQQEQQAAAVA